MKDLNDDQLIKLCKEGKPEALEVFCRRYRDKLFNFILRMVGDRDNAEDLLQETLLRVLKKLPLYQKQKGTAFISWVYKVANNLIIDWQRSKGNKEISLETTIVDAKGKEIELREILPDKQSVSPEDQLARKKLKEELETAIALLPFDQRQVFILRQYSGLSFKEIAKMLDCPLNTVLGRMHYALKKLKDTLTTDEIS